MAFMAYFGLRPLSACRGKAFAKLLLVMRITTFLILVACLQVSARGVTQVTLHVKDAPLEKVFSELERQTGYQFFYRKALVAEFKNVDVAVSGAGLEQVLDLVLNSQHLGYTIVGKTVVVTKKGHAVAVPIAEPVRIITGRITNAEGEAMAGVSVSVKGSTTGTSTDKDGVYSIGASDENVLVFSHVGFEVKEVVVGRQTSIDIRMMLSSKGSLGEVVVTAFGIKRAEKAIAYSTQTIGSDKVNVAKEPVNPINSLKGQVAGLTITNVGDGISSSPKVLLRGIRSLTGNNAPLYVTDGVPSDIGLLDPNNIESITVLKGASAAAAYGSAGQNGAIIITTKAAKSGKFSVNYNGGMRFDQAQILADFQYEYGQGEGGIYYPNSENSWGPKATGQMVQLWNGRTVPLEGQPNRFKEFYQLGKTINNSISISGGNDKMQTYFAYANTRILGVLRANNELTRHTFEMKIKNNITSKFSISADFTYGYDDQSISSQYPYSSIYVIPTSIPISEMRNYKYTDANGMVQQNYWKPNSLGSNPYFTMNGDISKTIQNKMMGLFTAKYKFSDWIDLQVRGSITKMSSKNDQDKYAGISLVQSVWGSDYYLTTSAIQSTYVDALLTYKRDLSNNFTLSGNFGASIQDGKTEGITSHANGLFVPDLFYIGNGKAPITTNSYSRSPEVQGIYGLATLAYKNYLFLELTGRNDWSSALPKGHQSYFYPSAGLTAILSDIIRMPQWVSFGKARISYAQSGYGGIQYLDKTYYSIGPGGVIVTPTIQTLGNYKPELTSSYEAGLDWRFFKNRFGFNATYYHTDTKNQLLLIGAPSASLYDQRYINAGLIRNSGVELTVNLTPVKTNDLSWDITLNYAKNKNKVIKLTDEVKSVIISGGGGSSSAATIKAVEGSSYGDIYVKGWQRDSSGRKLVNDQGIPLLTAGQDIKVGNYNPNFMMGISNSFSYKNFTLSFLIDYRDGGRVISASEALLDGKGVTKATLNGRNNDLILDAYTADGKKNTTAISAQSYYGSIGDIYLSGEFYNYSATNIRLREMVISYRLPASILKKGILSSAEIALTGRNLFYFLRQAPFDPEIGSAAGNSGGQEFGYIPSTRSYGFNIKLSF